MQLNEENKEESRVDPLPGLPLESDAKGMAAPLPDLTGIKKESPLDTNDWTGLPAKAKEISPTIGPNYDPRPQEDNARRTIAYLLIGLLIVLVESILAMVSFNIIQVADIKDFSVILGPVVTLVSAATGFYYGTKTK